MSLNFLYGKNLIGSNIDFQAGTIYLDTATQELFFDDPDPEANEADKVHKKIIDTSTLIYMMEQSEITFPSTGGSEEAAIPGLPNTGGSTTTTARLGSAVLGHMILGQE